MYLITTPSLLAITARFGVARRLLSCVPLPLQSPQHHMHAWAICICICAIKTLSATQPPTATITHDCACMHLGAHRTAPGHVGHSCSRWSTGAQASASLSRPPSRHESRHAGAPVKSAPQSLPESTAACGYPCSHPSAGPTWHLCATAPPPPRGPHRCGARPLLQPQRQYVLCWFRSTGLETVRLNETRWRQQFQGRPYLNIYDAEYPVGELRQAALDMVRPPSLLQPAADGLCRCAPRPRLQGAPDGRQAGRAWQGLAW